VLLHKIIALATDAEKSPSVLLRQCVVLGHELKNSSLKTWANQELNGYRDPQALPEYRVLHAGAIGVFHAGYAFPTMKRPIPASAMREEHRWAASELRLCQPISAYENALKSETGKQLVVPWNAELITYYQEEFLEGHALVQAYQELSSGDIVGLLDTVRNRALNVALDIKDEIGESDTELRKVPASSEAAQKVDHIIINHIYGGTVLVAHQQTVNTQNISVGNWEDLRNALLALKIPEGEISELSKAAEQDGQKLGNSVPGWIARNAGKLWDHGLQVSTSVGTTILTEYLKNILAYRDESKTLLPEWFLRGGPPAFLCSICALHWLLSPGPITRLSSRSCRPFTHFA
jgi:AbiTii-like protein